MRLKINSQRVKGGGVIIVMVAISLSDVINCGAPGLNLSDWPAGFERAAARRRARATMNQAGAFLQRREATRRRILQIQCLCCQWGSVKRRDVSLKWFACEWAVFCFA